MLVSNRFTLFWQQYTNLLWYNFDCNLSTDGQFYIHGLCEMADAEAKEDNKITK